MSIYERLHGQDNDFILGAGITTHLPRLPRMPVLDANQPARIVSLTAPDNRPAIESLNLAPPFERFFIEASLPREMQRISRTSSLALVRGNVQNCILRQPVTDIAMDVSSVSVTDDIAIKFAGSASADDAQAWRDSAERVRWALLCECFYNLADLSEPMCYSNYQFMLMLGDDGFPVPIPGVKIVDVFASHGTGTWVGADGSPYAVFCRHGLVDRQRIRQMDSEEVAALREGVINELREFLPLFYAINSLHSKRTEIVTVPLTRQQRRHATRNGGQQPPDHRTIVVKDFVRIYKDAQKAKSEGNKYPLHEVIGHWRSYGVNGRKGLLFGKYAGTFFIPSFLKGDPNSGATDHDYRLTA